MGHVLKSLDLLVRLLLSLADITGQYGFAGLQFATFIAGGILIIMGLMRLGSVIKFIPEPVIAGFTSGIGVIILLVSGRFLWFTSCLA